MIIPVCYWEILDLCKQIVLLLQILLDMKLLFGNFARKSFMAVVILFLFSTFFLLFDALVTVLQVPTLSGHAHMER